MSLKKNSFDIFLISFVFYTSNSLEEGAENSRVLLNIKEDYIEKMSLFYLLNQNLTEKEKKRLS